MCQKTEGDGHSFGKSRFAQGMDEIVEVPLVAIMDRAVAEVLPVAQLPAWKCGHVGLGAFECCLDPSTRPVCGRVAADAGNRPRFIARGNDHAEFAAPLIHSLGQSQRPANSTPTLQCPFSTAPNRRRP
jgi:hypothetical protein